MITTTFDMDSKDSDGLFFLSFFDLFFGDGDLFMDIIDQDLMDQQVRSDLWDLGMFTNCRFE
jgi:hypothetical protein